MTTSASPVPASRTVPRVIATDLDGTLLRADGTVSDFTRRTLTAADEAGIDVLFVTARPPRWLGELAPMVGAHGGAICLGGACVLDMTSGRVTESQGFDAVALRVLVTDLRRELPRITFGAERVDGATFESTYPVGAWAGPSNRGLSIVGRIEDSLSGRWPTAKLLARLTIEDAALLAEESAFLAAVESVAQGRAHLAYSGATGLAELLPWGVSKASMLARWCAARGIEAADVWAFGDMPNDLPMLQWAGRSFAVANADPRVLESADHRTASNDDDGVAAAIATVLNL